MKKISFTLAALVGSIISSQAMATVYTGTGGPLVDAGTNVGIASFDIVIPTSSTVSSVNSVTLTGLTHTWLGDLVVGIIAPDGTTNTLLLSPRDLEDSNLNGTYTMVVDPLLPTIDEASLPLGDADDLPSGSYAIAGYGGGSAMGGRTDYSMFVGTGMQGIWTLELDDYAAGDSGSLVSWSIDITSAPVPEPTSLAALGFLSLALRRRHA